MVLKDAGGPFACYSSKQGCAFIPSILRGTHQASLAFHPLLCSTICMAQMGKMVIRQAMQDLHAILYVIAHVGAHLCMPLRDCLVHPGTCVHGSIAHTVYSGNIPWLSRPVKQDLVCADGRKGS